MLARMLGFVIVAMAAFLANAQTWTNSTTGEIYTNFITDRSGYVTNRDYLTPFSVTNGSGVVMTNLVMVRLMGDRFIYRAPDGAEGSALMLWLSPPLKERFRYDEKRAIAAQVKDEIAQADWQEEKEEAAERDQRAALMARMAKLRQFICGDVVQKIEEGVLLNSPGSYQRFTLNGFGDIVPMDSHLILVKDYSGAANLAADDQLSCWAYPIGVFSYTTVNNSENSVHAYTCDLNEAIKYYSATSNIPSSAVQ